MNDFSDKIIWVTGASSGIGEALALALVDQGATVVLSARSVDALNQVQQKCAALRAGSATVLPLDVTEEHTLTDKAQRVLSEHGRIDMLVNNAGISQRSSCLSTEMSTYRKIFDVDVFGQIALSKAVLPIMIRQGGGHIAVTASVAGKIGVPFRTGYSAAKHAVMGFFDALRTEVHHHNIRVTTIVPGYIRTNISANAVAGDGSRFGRLDSDIRAGMSAEDCATVIVRELKRGKPEIAVGVGTEMHGLWLKRFFPRLLLKIMNKQYAKSAKRDGFE